MNLSHGTKQDFPCTGLVNYWAGVTLSLKNMFGVVPGSCYGWPRNVLHWAGIGRAICKCGGEVRFRDCGWNCGMEGNGPIQGTLKASEMLVFGDDAVAVAATGCRAMGLVLEKVKYPAQAGTTLSHVNAYTIHQVRENVVSVRSKQLRWWRRLARYVRRRERCFRGLEPELR